MAGVYFMVYISILTRG